MEYRAPACGVENHVDSVHAMARVLIGWASRAGAASDIADVVGDELRELGHDVDVADLKSEPDVTSRDLVVLGSGIQAGQWYPEATTWARDNEAALTVARVAVFNVCLNAANPSKREESLGYNKVMAALLDPVACESFAGRFVPEKVSWFKRLFLRTLQQKPQDHVDQQAVRAWARELVEFVHP